jgi:hypothetical protein
MSEIFPMRPDRVESAKGRMRLRRVHRRLDDAGRDRVHANAALCVLNSKRSGRRGETTLGQGRQHRGHIRIRVVDEAGGDLDNVAAALLLHLGDGELGGVEEAREIDPKDIGVVGLGVLGEGLCNEDACIVDQRVDAPEPRDSLRNRALGRPPIGDVAGDTEHGVVA